MSHHSAPTYQTVRYPTTSYSRHRTTSTYATTTHPPPSHPVEEVYPDPTIPHGRTQPTTRAWDVGIRFHKGAHCCLQTRTKQEIYECLYTHITSSSIPLSNPNYWRRVYPPLTSTEPAPPDGLNDPPSRHHHHAPQFLPNPSQPYPYPSHSHSQSHSSPQPYLPSVQPQPQPQPAPIPSARRASASASTHSRPDMTSASLSIDPHRAHRPSSMVAYPYGTDPAAVAPNAYDSRAAGGRGHGYDPYAAQSAPSAQAYGAAPGHGYAQPHQPSPPYSAHGRSSYAPY